TDSDTLERYEALRRSDPKAAAHLLGAEVKARYATVLLHLGDTQPAQELLRLDPDPIYRTAFIHGFPSWHSDLTVLPELVRKNNHDAFRTAVCAALGLIETAIIHSFASWHGDLTVLLYLMRKSD